MTKLPIIETATEAVGFGFKRAGMVARLGWAPMMLAVAVSAAVVLLVFGSTAKLLGGWADFAAMLSSNEDLSDMSILPLVAAFQAFGSLLPYIAMILFVPLYVVITRIAADDIEAPRGIGYFRFGIREILFAAATVFLPILLVAVILVAVIPSLIVLVIGLALNEWEQLSNPFLIAIIPIAILSALAVIWVSARLTIFLPAVAVEKDFALARAWQMGKANGWRIFFSSLLFAFLVIALVSVAYAVLAAVFGGIGYGVYLVFGTHVAALAFYGVLGIAAMIGFLYMLCVGFGAKTAFPGIIYRNLKDNLTAV